MKLFYVEHTVLSTARFALLAEDEEQLKVVLAEREASLRKAPFTSKISRDKGGKVQSFALGSDWDPGTAPQAWDGKI